MVPQEGFEPPTPALRAVHRGVLAIHASTLEFTPVHGNSQLAVAEETSPSCTRVHSRGIQRIPVEA